MIELTADEKSELIETRRDLHRHPEVAFEEVRTAGVVAERLRGLGLEPVTGLAGTGVTAMLESAKPGKCVLLRADMDALPVFEETEHDFQSQVEGKMHACAHDGHTSTALTTARVLQRLPLPRGSVKMLFQPAEEIAAGAAKMIDQGVLETPRVDAAFGLHYWNYLEAGTVGVTSGPIMAAADEFEIRILGEGCHASKPHEGRDPVLASAQVISALQQIASRIVDPMQKVAVSVTTIHGGETFNVIPEEVVMTGTCRSFDTDVWETIPDVFGEIVKRTASAFDCEAEIVFNRSTPPVVNDRDMTELVREVAADIVGAKNILDERTMGAEDFAEYLRRVPGCFFFVGSRNESTGKIHPHHSPRFDIDEGVLPLGAQLLAGVAVKYLETD